MKDTDAGEGRRQEEKGVTEVEMIGWHHGLNGDQCKQTQRNSEGQGSQACCSLWGGNESETTEQLNSNNYSCV